jgi:APA family basic amino acid/polyamine antiporter
VWALIGDANETYDLTNIGTLFAFALVCIGVMVLRHTDPDRPRPFRVPFVYFVGVAGAILCVIVMWGLPGLAWRRFGVWLGAGLLLYLVYGYRHSTLRRRDQRR